MPFFGKKKKEKMPFFRHQSEKCRRRQQNQETISEQDPEPRYDVSACEMSQVPSHIYFECKGLLKEVLLLHDNWLTDLGPEGGISDITRLRILDVHNNKIKHLPDDFGSLQLLQILDLSNNKMKHLPDSFAQLESLQTLKLQQNRFKTLPDCICRLRCLRTLDISDNEITELPVGLCRAKALDTLVLDVDKMTFPPQDICKKGTGATMMFLCGEAGIDYEHPSKYWLRISGEARRMSAPSSSHALEQLSQMEAEGIQAYQNVLDQKRKDAIELEKTVLAEEQAQAELAVRVTEQQRRFMSAMTENDAQMSKDLSDYASKREQERKKALQSLIDDEKRSSILASQILDYNAKAKEMEEILQEAELERQREDNWARVTLEEYQNVRKKEMLDAMETMLAELKWAEQAGQRLDEENEELRRHVVEEMIYEDEIMEKIVDLRHKEQAEIVAELSKQEELQKAAFEALLISKDAQYSRIKNQMTLIEAELSQLTKQELKNREERKEQELNALCDERIALSLLFANLLEEKERRNIDFKKQLIEMEQQKEDGQTDYWLVQYQRLMDWKPQTLIDKETHLEKAVKEILEASGASDYTAKFARHRITIETLQTLTDADLKSMGIYQLGLRRSILMNVDSMTGNAMPAKDKIKSLLREPSMSVAEPSQVQVPQEAMPSAPPVPLPPSLLERQSSITARGLNSECSICMEKDSNIIFLPCGHVCCCGRCSQAVKECPLCRETIQARVKLSFPSSSV